MKQHYKDFCKEYIGESDIASLILVGCGKKRLLLKELGFDGDDSYSAYIVDGGDVVIGSHIEKMDVWVQTIAAVTQRIIATCKLR